MRSCAPKFLLLLVCLAVTKVPSEAIDPGLSSPIWQVRRDAFERIAGKSTLLSSQILQRELVHLREFETIQVEKSSDDLFEDDDYVAYDDQLTELTQKIAVSSNSPAAWRSLVYTHYNPDSELGMWLADQKPAFPFIMEQTRSKFSARRMVSVYLLALILFRSKSDHSLTDAQYATFKKKIRYLIENDIAPVRQSAIVGLGRIGDSEDKALLEKMQRTGEDSFTRKVAHEALEKIQKDQSP
jgi:hypothetical protein